MEKPTARLEKLIDLGEKILTDLKSLSAREEPPEPPGDESPDHPSEKISLR